MSSKMVMLTATLVLICAAAGCGSTGGGGDESGTTLSAQLNELLERTTSALQGIVDVESASPARQTLGDVDAELADLVKRAPQASAESRQELAMTAEAALPGLGELGERVMAIPGVGAEIGPTMKRIVESLSQLL